MATRRSSEWGARTQLQVVGSYLVRALTLEAPYGKAEDLALFVERLDPTGIAEIALARWTRAKAVAALGRVDDCAALAREDVALVDRTDFLSDRADARMDLAEVLRRSSRPADAARILEEARRQHEQKGNVVSADRASALLAGPDC